MSLTAPASDKARWLSGNQFELLENGEQFFPAVFAAIDAAKWQLLLETFILFEDEVGCELHRRLLNAARRGVSIDLTIDGYGSPDLSAEFKQRLVDAGVRIHVYDPQPRIFGLRANIFRRLHRKIVAVDEKVAFIGGINYSIDHLVASGPRSKLDYAVRISGPLALEIQRFARIQAAAFGRPRSRWWQGYPARFREECSSLDASSQGKALLVTRDNHRHRNDIERHYRIAIRAAKREIIICNAYFFPGYRLLRQLRHAARRGVSVKLILQGEPDMPAAQAWTTMLYPQLIQAGVEIHEYCRRPLHAKVAVIDDDWATVGSSNLDPLSLALNLEANVVIRDAKFNELLRGRLLKLIREDCMCLIPSFNQRGTGFAVLTNTLAYHCTRHFPSWAGWLPLRKPRLQSVEAGSDSAEAGDEVADARGAG